MTIPSTISIKVSSALNAAVILTGDASVGKSNFLLRYIKGKFENSSPTIGVEFAYKTSILKNKTRVKA